MEIRKARRSVPRKSQILNEEIQMKLDDLPKDCPLQKVPQTFCRPSYIARDIDSPTGLMICSDEYDPIPLTFCPEKCSFAEKCVSPADTLKKITEG